MRMVLKSIVNVFRRSSQHFLPSICIAAVVILPLVGCSKEEEVIKKEMIRPAKIMTIAQASTTQTFKYPGKVQALDRVEVSFEVSGKLVALVVKEGQEVNNGDVIARIDASDYQSRLDAALAKVNHAKTEVDRYANLLKEKVVAKATYDVKKKTYDVAVSDMKIAKKAVDDTTLRAPFSGMIGKKFVENYQVVQAKQPIVSLHKISGLEIIVNAPENVIGRRTDTDRAELTAEFANYPGERFPVTVKEFATEADPQTQTYRVVLSMMNPKDKKILSGMTATVFMVLYESSGKTVEIPVQSVFYDEKGQAYIWKVGDDSRVKRHQVTAGMLKQDSVEILSGLASGDKIITAGVQNLTEGQKVREYTGTMGE